MRKFIIALLSIGLMGLFTSCEKEQLPLEGAAQEEIAPLTTTEADEKAEPIFSEDKLVHTETLTFEEPVSNNRSSTVGYNYQEVYSNTYSLSTGHWVNIEMPKSRVSNQYQYVTVVTPEYGDPDVYVRSHYQDRHGVKYTRTRRSSKRRGYGLEESWLNHRDFNQRETHGSFYLYSSNRCSFKVKVYQVPINTIWIRHASTHYGSKNIQLQYGGVSYGLRPNTSIALPYNYQKPSFRLWQCITRRYPRRHDVCGWKTTGQNTTSTQQFMYSLADSNASDQEQGGIGFKVTQGH